MNLLDKARKHVVIVSPYNKIKNWFKLAPYLKRLKDRGLPVEYYVRKDHPRSPGVQEVIDAGFAPIEIEGLHCKFYLNESYGIVTSMNLLISSDVNALEIGYVTETQREYDELVEFLEFNIRNRLPAAVEPALIPEAEQVVETVKPGITAEKQADNFEVQPPPNAPAEPEAPIIGSMNESAFQLLRQNPNFGDKLTLGGGQISADLINLLSLKIQFRGVYVLVAYSFARSARLRLYKALYAQREELEAKVGSPLSWGNEMHRLKLEGRSASHLLVSQWGPADVALLCQRIERATPVIQEQVQQWSLATAL